MKETQYTRILKALRQAGKRGCTNHDLMLYSNCPWKRIEEMTYRHFGGLAVLYDCYWTQREFMRRDVPYIERGTRIVNSRAVRVYRLVRA